MAPVVTVLNHALATIDGFFIDCLLSDNHVFDADVTEFPVESGSTISDNIRNKPLVVTMECLISNAPLGQLVSLRDKVSDPTDSAYDLLLKIRNDRRPVSIGTSLRHYDNMALQSLSIPRESGRGDELKFTAVFKQIEFVTNIRDKRVAIVGAKSSGPRTFSPVQDTSTGYIYVDVRTNTWWDDAIVGWRSNVIHVQPSSVQHIDGQTVIPGTEPDQVTLLDGCPELISLKVYNNEPRSLHSIPLLKARLKAIHNGAPDSPLRTRDPRNLITLPPNGYRLLRFAAN
jgi:hypothetical protein